MHYLIISNQENAENFVTDMFTELQPVQPSTTTNKWTGYTVHPQTGQCLVFIPDDFLIPIKENINPQSLDNYLNTLITEEVLNADVVPVIHNLLSSSQGQMLNVSNVIQSMLANTNRLITYEQAVQQGFIEEKI
jgi:hypothetical protein